MKMVNEISERELRLGGGGSEISMNGAWTDEVLELVGNLLVLLEILLGELIAVSYRPLAGNY